MRRHHAFGTVAPACARRRLRLGAWLCAACFVQGCATQAPGSLPSKAPGQTVDERRRADFDLSQNEWHGLYAKDLRARLGAPTHITQARDGSQVLSYTKSRLIRGEHGPERFSCTVNYTVRGDPPVVVAHSIEGC